MESFEMELKNDNEQLKQEMMPGSVRVPFPINQTKHLLSSNKNSHW